VVVCGGGVARLLVELAGFCGLLLGWGEGGHQFMPAPQKHMKLVCTHTKNTSNIKHLSQLKFRRLTQALQRLVGAPQTFQPASM